MVYVYHIEDEYFVFTNIKVLSEATGISYHTLRHQFKRLNRKRYIRDGAVIVATKLQGKA